ncbi:hypothetical protein EON65_11930 [archaeon]|nr:MAG: hypothetical protein EON65_11930 [archaeon]
MGFLKPRWIRYSIFSVRPTPFKPSLHSELSSSKERDANTSIGENGVSSEGCEVESHQAIVSKKVLQPAVLNREALFALPEPLLINLEEYITGVNPVKVSSIEGAVETVGSFRFLLDVDEASKGDVRVTGQPLDASSPGASQTPLHLDSSLLFALQDAEMVETEDTITYRLDMDMDDFLVAPTKHMAEDMVGSYTATKSTQGMTEIKQSKRTNHYPRIFAEIYNSLKSTSLSSVLLDTALNFTAIVFLTLTLLCTDYMAIAIRDFGYKIFIGVRRYVRSRGVVRGDNYIAVAILSAVVGTVFYTAKYFENQQYNLDWVTEYHWKKRLKRKLLGMFRFGKKDN